MAAGTAAEPDLTPEEIRGRLRQRGIKVSASSVWRFCERHDLTFKKSLHAAEQDREDVRKARANGKRSRGLIRSSSSTRPVLQPT